jgi:hypothetical protein
VASNSLNRSHILSDAAKRAVKQTWQMWSDEVANQFDLLLRKLAREDEDPPTTVGSVTVTGDLTIVGDTTLPPEVRQRNYLRKLRALKELSDEVDRFIEINGRSAIAVGASYSDVGEVIGLTRQRAYQRFSPNSQKPLRRWRKQKYGAAGPGDDILVVFADRKYFVIKREDGIPVHVKQFKTEKQAVCVAKEWILDGDTWLEDRQPRY